MKFEHIRNIYFIGIGGIGMSALARYFNVRGAKVSGYDKTRTKLTDELLAEGIAVHFDENLDAIPENIDLVVTTPAVPQDHKELVYFKENNFKIYKRSEVLGIITQDTFTIAVAGTHGKTSVTSIVSHILQEADYRIAAFIGGVTKNYGTNVIINPNPEYTVVEADEFDRSFLTLHPNLAVITSMDADHLDIYENESNLHESFNQFVRQIKPGGKLFIREGVEDNITADVNYESYAISTTAIHQANNIHSVEGHYVFDYCGFDEIANIKTGSAAFYNVTNALPAIAIAKTIGISDDVIKKALASYVGVKRRFECILKTEHKTYIDDYAHHPAEILSCIRSARKSFPQSKITAVFQPHLYSRTRDFADDFAQALDQLDEVILLDIYPARELPIEGVSSQMILDKMTNSSRWLMSKDELIDKIRAWDIEVLITMGAGDIDMLIEPIKNELLKDNE